ncbi:hypothetical protein GJ744_002348 [Endocarpon pusillum]|uniref:F-box domain-containing protein n=1 Tax=Endocarpon pusillum TaxID=364733 RepID=A0A8H7E9Z0_9EURO|nr:hypothetical protein GJ744_002348 [Endocarpon pusillum]
MQSQPIDTQPNETDNLTLQSTPSAQHGLWNDFEPSSSPLPTGRADEDAVQQYKDVDALSHSSGGSSRGRKPNVRRLKSYDRSYHGFSPVNRVEEYERSHLPSNKDDGISFQVISSVVGVKRHISVEQFPNEVITHILSHLPPSTLSAMSLVSRRFHNMVTTPHAWRIAFSRYFPGQDVTGDTSADLRLRVSGQQIMRSERRLFSRLSALASWRSEYILRTRLLRSLARGKPGLFHTISRSGASRYNGGGQAAAVVTYSSNLVYPVSHIHATFGSGLNKKIPFFMHGASEYGVVTVSDPSAGKVTETWGGNTDYSAFHYFEDSAYSGEAMWGLGAGDLVGVPNTLDLSHGYGRIYAEGLPGGRVFFTPISDRRGVFLTVDSPANHDLGIPDVNTFRRSVCSTWIVKSERVLKMSCGLFGLLVGYSNGVLAAFSIGAHTAYDYRFEKGQPTAKWVLSPGVPIIAIQVDENISSRRQGQHKIWAVALNALGEVFFLSEFPVRPETKGKPSEDEVHQIAWQTGRSVQWTLIEATRRVSRPDPFNAAAVDGSYSPRSSSKAAGLSKEQLNAETREIEMFLSYRPNYFQKICEDWDMRRRLVIDFAGAEHIGAGESIFVLICGFDEERPAAIRRLMRHRIKLLENHDLEKYPVIQPGPTRQSIFGNDAAYMSSPSYSTPISRTSSNSEIGTAFRTEWRLSEFTLGGLKGAQISATATDDSHFAVITAREDPLLGMSGGSNASSPLASPLGHMAQPSSVSEIPGQRARFMAAGTSSGVVLIWNMREASSPDVGIINSIAPLRMIYTESPQISCLALTSLYVVHGGNDGLVQAWDPLASTTEPIRTLNSRFSSRARRRLIQAETSLQGAGNNYYAAGAVVLDPDPTVLRGIVSLGTHLRYWSYSSSAADQYKSGKRKLRRRSERGSNATTTEQRFSHTGRGVLKDYITNEKQELEREKIARRKEHERISGRFGTDLLGPGASEEEMLAYATMLSEESYTSDEVKRRDSGGSDAALSSASSDTVHEGNVSICGEAATSLLSASANDPENLEPDVAEAIRLSLLEQEGEQTSPLPHARIQIRYGKKASSPSPSSPNAGGSHRRSPTTTVEEDDLDFALQLSLAEEQSRQGDIADLEDEFPALALSATSPSSDLAAKQGKGKGKL